MLEIGKREAERGRKPGIIEHDGEKTPAFKLKPFIPSTRQSLTVRDKAGPFNNESREA